MEKFFLSQIPQQWNVITLFGITLLLGLIGGELSKRIKYLPIISGYIFVGFLLGPGGFNVISLPVIAISRIFIDISLGIILFELGRHLDFSWLRNDRGILPAAITDSLLTFAFVFLAMRYIADLSWLPSALAASFCIATSPAVVLMVANDLKAEGPVTRRTIILTSLNNFFALLTFTALLPLTITPKFSVTWVHSCYLIFGSIILGVLMYAVTALIARITEKKNQQHFVLFIGSLVLTIGAAQAFNLPTALTLFVFGVATRNLDDKHRLLEIDFGWSARLFFIILFVVTGTYLRLEAFAYATTIILSIILLRSFAKVLGLWIFSSQSNITRKQIFAISLALTPMAGLAINMSNVLDDFNPDINRQISGIIAAVVTILEIIGPIATQFAFIKTKESAVDTIQ